MNELSNTDLINRAKTMVNGVKTSVLIVWKNLDENVLSSSEVKSYIEGSYCVGKPVYIQGAIATWIAYENYNDYSNCNPMKKGNNKAARLQPLTGEDDIVKPEQPCPMVRTTYAYRHSSYLPSFYNFTTQVGFEKLTQPKDPDLNDYY